MYGPEEWYPKLCRICVRFCVRICYRISILYIKDEHYILLELLRTLQKSFGTINWRSKIATWGALWVIDHWSDYQQLMKFFWRRLSPRDAFTLTLSHLSVADSFQTDHPSPDLLYGVIASIKQSIQICNSSRLRNLLLIFQTDSLGMACVDWTTENFVKDNFAMKEVDWSECTYSRLLVHLVLVWWLVR